MKRILTILAILLSVGASAQRIRVSDFRQLPGDQTAVSATSRVKDVNGNPCALIKISTAEKGWTFEAGLAGVMDTRYEQNSVLLYIPSDARELSISHADFGALRGWAIPVSLEGGSTYSMKLTVAAPASSPAPKPVQVRTAAPSYQSSRMSQSAVRTPKPALTGHYTAVPVARPRVSPMPATPTAVSEKNFCSHFLDAYGGLSLCCGETDDVYVGLRYTYISGRAGAYASAALNTYDELSGTTGLAIRLLPEEQSSFDWHLYGGVGFFEEEFIGGEIGTRFAWKSRHAMSPCDFELGCQFWEGSIMPTVGVGFYIWGIPVAVCFGICCCAVGY